ncbi:MAG: hypothetical protein ACYSU3_06145 [Planctomycetota bacterium]|jgi:hypothetical protein
MTVKEFWTRTKSKTTTWLHAHKPTKVGKFRPQVNEEGLISANDESAVGESVQAGAQSDTVLVKTVPPTDKQQSLEKLEAGFDKLIEQLQGINQHLNRQVVQNEELMSRIEQLPKLLERQSRRTSSLLIQLRRSRWRRPNKPMRLSISTISLRRRPIRMCKWWRASTNLTTASQTDGIVQMSRTFATSDRYLKYILSKQNRRFMWVFIAAIGVCVMAILILTGIIIFLRSGSG